MKNSNTPTTFNLGQRLKSLRIYRGYSSAEVTAHFLQISRSQYTRYETGHNMSTKSLFTILDFWGVNYSDFFSNKPFQISFFKDNVLPDNLLIYLHHLISTDQIASPNKIIDLINDVRHLKNDFSNSLLTTYYFSLRASFENKDQLIIDAIQDILIDNKSDTDTDLIQVVAIYTNDGKLIKPKIST